MRTFYQLLLNLVTECHSLSYDALTAHVAIVFARYMMIAYEQRKNSDERTLGELFFFFVDELADINFNQAFQIIMKAVFESLYVVFKLSDEQMDQFINSMYEALPDYMRKYLHKVSASA